MLAATMRVPEKAKVDKLNAVSRGPAPLPWQHSWSAVLGGGLPAASVSGDLPDLGIKPVSPASPALQVDSLPLELLGLPKKAWDE